MIAKKIDTLQQDAAGADDAMHRLPGRHGALSRRPCSGFGKPERDESGPQPR